ncbi:MAG: hypothetical protein WCK29_04425, partial [archaeon]
MNTRILIIGAGGSGKTTLAKKIGKILKIKNKSIDDFRYSKDFKIGFSQEKADKSSKKFLKNKNWILDGIYSERYIDPALKKAKTIIVLKSRRINLILRVIKREISFRKKYNDRPFSDLIKLLYWSQKYKN